MFVQYTGGDSATGSRPRPQLTGTGDAWVFTGGQASSRGTGRGPTSTKPAKLTNATGAEIRLTPGQTWVELPDASYPVTTLPDA